MINKPVTLQQVSTPSAGPMLFEPFSRKFCVAPMMDWTDRHCRYFHRLITREAVLYTEMVTTGALIHGDRDRFLSFDAAEHPVALQLGGNDPDDLAACANMAESYGYDEVNLNVGCPSDRVQNGRFGACLMADPGLVADCISKMSASVAIPVTVKTRIGIDDQDSYAMLENFVATVSRAGCRTFIIHARKAILNGLTPKQNRDIPPLRYDRVARLKQDFPHLEIILNGGITSLDTTAQMLIQFDGVMIGREAYHNPFILAGIDQRFYGMMANQNTREEILKAYIPYIRMQLDKGVRLHNMSRHIIGLFNGVGGAKRWRRHLSENACRVDADETVILDALKYIQY